jgi:hypothetical protein
MAHVLYCYYCARDALQQAQRIRRTPHLSLLLLGFVYAFFTHSCSRESAGPAASARRAPGIQILCAQVVYEPQRGSRQPAGAVAWYGWYIFCDYGWYIWCVETVYALKNEDANRRARCTPSLQKIILLRSNKKYKSFLFFYVHYFLKTKTSYS